MRTTTVGFCCTFLLSVSLLTSTAPAHADVYFVSAASTATNPDGYSWETAYKSVQEGLDSCIAGDEVWVTAGTYHEKFILKNGVALYGGFASTETDRNQRDWTSNATVLDGGGSGTVVTVPTGATATTVLDGFTVKNGANGVSCNGSSPTISHNLITGNNSACGIQLVNSSALITDNAITGNTSVAPTRDNLLLSGAGIRCRGGAPYITRNSISNNLSYSELEPGQSYGDGAGIFFYNGAKPVLSYNTFSNNRANRFGGAVACEGADVVLSLTGDTFSENSGYSGGAIYVHLGTVSPTDTTIRNNTASFQGGGIFCSSGHLTVRNSTISENTSINAGAGIYQNGVSLSISHSIVTENSGVGVQVANVSLSVENTVLASNTESGLVVQASSGRVWNNTLVGNIAGNGLSISGSSTPTVANNIVAFNASGISAVSVTVLQYNCVAGNTNYDYSGIEDQTGINGNILANPRFVNRTSGDYRLTSTSGCIDMGDDTVIMASQRDLDGKMRIIGGHVDIGAYEFGSVGPRTMQDAADALKVYGGLQALAESDSLRLNVDRGIPSDTSVDMYDIAWLVRQLTGLDPNP